MGTTAFYAISFLTNAAILVFEIAGGRLLAPYLGTSVGVWAGLISIVLGGMAIGYRYGGSIADKDASQKTIGTFLLAASATALLAWSVRDLIPTLFSATGLPETFGALLVGAVLFMPTVIILAALSPMIAKNLLTRLEDSARVVGTLNAVGTIGSIVGAVATGAVFVSYFGVDVILLGVAAMLFIMACLLLSTHLLKLGSFVLAVGALALLLNTFPTKVDTVVADISTAYNRIFITHYDTRFTKEALAMSTSPTGIQCAMFIDEEGNADDSQLVFSYLQAYDMVIRQELPEGPERALVLGGCNYSFPRYLLHQYPKAVVDAVEIDPAMTEVARDYFGFDEKKFPTLSILHEDARIFLNLDHEPYDVIVMDAFGSSLTVPFHLTTVETFERMSEHLTDDGLMIVNALGSYEGKLSQFPAAYVATARTIFPHVSLYKILDTPTQAQNLVLVASKKHALPESFSNPTYPRLVLTEAKIRDDGLVLTDNYAPVERFAGFAH